MSLTNKNYYSLYWGSIITKGCAHAFLVNLVPEITNLWSIQKSFFFTKTFNYVMNDQFDYTK